MGAGLFEIEIRAKGKEGIGRSLPFVQLRAKRLSFFFHLLKNPRKHPKKK
jgi:hypothetical protein